MILYAFQLDNGVIDLIQRVGFPIAIALGLLWFLYKVWNYVTTKLDEKDILIKDIITKSDVHRDRMIDTQNNLTQTQRDITEILATHTELITDVKNYLSNPNIKR